MNKIVIVHHAFMTGRHYMEMMAEQYRLLFNSKLYQACDKLYIGVVDSPDKKPPWGEEWLMSFWNFSSSKEDVKTNSKAEVVMYPDNLELRRTLWWIRDYAKDNPDDYILFFHTKGITHFTQATEDWRRYMEYFVIEKWKDCVNKIDEGYDACGVLWNKETPIGIFPHFSGAFFWAKASYINTLDHSYIDSEWRYHMEFWIGSNPDARIYEFHNSGYNTTDRLIAGQGHYHLPYPRNMYAK